MTIRDQIRQLLDTLEPRRLAEQVLRDAAVLMPVFLRDGEPHFLLTLRTEQVETHKGQISFPGGMRHGDEDPQSTALRETLEEVGIDPGQVEVLGRFHEYLSITDFRVVTFVGFIDGRFAAKPHPKEVAEVLEVPFAFFRDPSRLRIERMERKGRLLEVYFYSYGHHKIWGLTAWMIRDFVEALDRPVGSSPPAAHA